MMQSSQPGQKQEVDSQTAFDMQYILYEQKRIVDHAILDDKIWSRFILAVAILGVSILLLGVGSSFLGLTTISYIGVAGGTITSAISILVYRPRRDNVLRVEKIYEDLAEQARIHYSFMLAGRLPVEAQERLTEKIIENLSYRQSKDREVPGLPVGRQTGKMIPQLPTNVGNDTNS